MVDARTRGRTVSRSRLFVIALVLVSLISLSIGVAALVRGPQLTPEEDRAVRQDVRAATERFAAAVNTYDVKNLDPYVAKVKPMLTDDLAEQFEASTQDLLSKFAEAGIVSKGTVDQVAIDSVDADSAVTLAAITITTEPANVQYGQPQLRWKVSLVRKGDTWLIDNFSNVTVAADPAAEDDKKDDQ